MDKNRRILIALLSIVVFSVVLSVINISLTMQKKPSLVSSVRVPSGPGVGVVRVYGRIESSQDILPYSGAEYVIKRLDDLASDGNIKAIVIRINSPGGTVAATQEIYSKIQSIRKKNIPIVASLGDIAASGGYYVASACDYIVANYGTITGSIGVIAIAPNLKGLFDKIGIRMNVIKSGKYKDILAMHRDLSPDEIQLIQQIIDSSYQKFVHDVAFGRNMSINDVMPYADGRVFTGSQALEYKLVDALGSFEDALNKAKSLAKLPDDCAIYEDSVTPFEKFLSVVGGLVKPSFNTVMQYNYSLVEYTYVP